MKLAVYSDIALNVEAARDYLEKSVDMIGVKELKDKAATIQRYLRARGASLEAQNKAAEIALRAAYRLGQLTRDLEKDAGGRPSKTTPQVGVVLKKEALGDLGITTQQASKFEAIAAIKPKDFERHVEETKKRNERITVNSALAVVRQEKKAERATELRSKPLPQAVGRFDVIVIDPPWQYEKRKEDITHRGRNPYPDMSLNEIKKLPVAARAERDCILWLWTTNAFMRDAFECLDAWGFEQKTILTWVKDRMGTGDWLRGKSEHCLLAVRGKPIVQLKNQTTVLEAPLRQHSRKPDEFFKLVESLCPGTRLEMFAREERKGWQLWGAETEHFSAAE